MSGESLRSHESSPEERRCLNCGKPLNGFVLKTYCSSKCRQLAWSKANPKKRRAIEKTYWKKHPIKKKLKDKRWRDKMLLANPNYWAGKSLKMRRATRVLWGELTSEQKCDIRQTTMYAEMAACKILKEEGFQNVIWLRLLSQTFPFDIAAERNGQKFAIEVTTSIQKQGKKELWKLLDFLDLHYYILHIRPDLNGFLMKELNHGQTCSTIYSIKSRLRSQSQIIVEYKMRGKNEK